MTLAAILAALLLGVLPLFIPACGGCSNTQQVANNDNNGPGNNSAGTDAGNDLLIIPPERFHKDPNQAPVTVRVQRLKSGDPLEVQVLAQLPVTMLMKVISEKRIGLRLAGENTTPIVGKIGYQGDSVSFKPAQPLTWETDYVAFLDLPDGRSELAQYSTPKKPEVKAPTVTGVFPASKTIPANLLKFYINFSTPMRGGDDIFDHFEIRDDKGKAVVQPWDRKELWSGNFMRLTLRVHPGRIKNEVSPREEMGPVLLPGRKYTLVVKRGLKNTDGLALEQDVETAYTTIEEDRTPIAPQDWTIIAPKPDTRDPLVIRFNETLDHELATSCLRVVTGENEIVVGTWTIGDSDGRVEFVPLKPWREMDHGVKINDLLEDLAGNRPGLYFDKHADNPEPRVPTLRLYFKPAK